MYTLCLWCNKSKTCDVGFDDIHYIHLFMIYILLNIYSRFATNSAAVASEFLVNLEEFPQYYIQTKAISPARLLPVTNLLTRGIFITKIQQSFVSDSLTN